MELFTKKDIFFSRCLVMEKILGIILVVLLMVTVIATPVLANPPTLNTVINNLQYSPEDFQYSSPKFRCGEMSAMSLKFFDVAGYDPHIVMGYDSIRNRWHAWIESPQFDSGMYYEAVTKTMRLSSCLDHLTNRVVFDSERCVWEGWYDWYDWRWTRGDMNDDGVIDFLDFVFFAGSYGTDITEVDYVMLGDMDLDGDVDIFDFVLFVDVYRTYRGITNSDGEVDKWEKIEEIDSQSEYEVYNEGDKK